LVELAKRTMRVGNTLARNARVAKVAQGRGERGRSSGLVSDHRTERVEVCGAVTDEAAEGRALEDPAHLPTVLGDATLRETSERDEMSTEDNAPLRIGEDGSPPGL
jgi:hypothetical protein